MAKDTINTKSLEKLLKKLKKKLKSTKPVKTHCDSCGKKVEYIATLPVRGAPYLCADCFIKTYGNAEK